MIKEFTFAILASALIAGPASALSCHRTHAVAAYKSVAEAKESFVILHGEFDFDASKVPDVNAPPREVQLETTFKGKLLTGKGFSEDVEVPVTLVLKCAGPWCARVSPRTDYLAYVLQGENRLTFGVGPCYAFAFANPKPEVITQIEHCAAGKECDVK